MKRTKTTRRSWQIYPIFGDPSSQLLHEMEKMSSFDESAVLPDIETDGSHSSPNGKHPALTVTCHLQCTHQASLNLSQKVRVSLPLKLAQQGVHQCLMQL